MHNPVSLSRSGRAAGLGYLDSCLMSGHVFGFVLVVLVLADTHLLDNSVDKIAFTRLMVPGTDSSSPGKSTAGTILSIKFFGVG